MSIDYYLSLACTVWLVGGLMVGGYTFVNSGEALLPTRIFKAIGAGLGWPIPAGKWLWEQVSSTKE